MTTTTPAQRVHLAPTLPTPPADRLSYLFRGSLRAGQVHPLFRLMQQRAQAYRNPVPLHSATLARGAGLVPAPGQGQVRSCVADLPPLPQAALRTLELLRREDASLEDLVTELGCDAALTARLLRLANSPLYGVSGRVCSVKSAVQVLGLRTLESVLTLAAVAGQLTGPRSLAFDLPAYWRHALATAIIARRLARSAGAEPELAFVVGLLHDIGQLVMSVHFPEALDRLIACARDKDLDLGEAERELGLAAHAEVGAWVAAHWRFPSAVIQAIASHDAPPAMPLGAKASLVDVVHVASAVAHALDIANTAHELVPMVDLAAWRRVALPDEEFARLFDEAQAGVAAMSVALSI